MEKIVRHIFGFIKNYIAEISISTYTIAGIPGKDDNDYEVLYVVLKNGKEQRFEHHSFGYGRSRPETEIIPIDDFPFIHGYMGNYFYKVFFFVCDEYGLSEIKLMGKHLQAFERGISVKENLIKSYKNDILRLKMHLEKNIVFYGYVNEISSYEIDRHYDNKKLAVKFDNNVEKISDIFGEVGIETFSNYHLLDMHMCEKLEGMFKNELFDKRKIGEYGRVSVTEFQIRQNS